MNVQMIQSTYHRIEIDIIIITLNESEQTFMNSTLIFPPRISDSILLWFKILALFVTWKDTISS